MTLDPVGSIWLVIAAALALVPLLAIGPRRGWSRRRRITLTALRGMTLLLLIAMLLRPAIETVEVKRLPATLLILSDVSRSMQVEDAVNDVSRYQAMLDVLASAEGELATLADAWDLRAYAFGQELAALEIEGGSLALPDEPDGAQTAIGSAIEDAISRESQQQRIAAVLLLSDGAQRAFAPRDAAPQDAVRTLVDYGVPLYTFAFGKPTLGQQSDLRLSDLMTNDRVFADAPTTVEAVVTANGFANQSGAVQLLWENADGELEPVDARKIEFTRQRQQQRVKLTHSPKEPGEYKVTLRVESAVGESVLANNEQSTFVTVLAGGVNVLYLAGAPRIGGGPGIEPRFVVSALAAHADMHVDYHLFNYRSPRANYRQQLKDKRYDAFLLGDVDVTALDNRSWRTMAEQVEQGAGLAMLGGFHSFGPGGFRGSPLADALPIEMGPAERQNFGERIRSDMHVPGPLSFAPVERNGAIHPLLRLREQPSDDLRAWKELPPLDGANALDPLRIKPNALTIAWSGDAFRRPLLVLGAWGAGRTAALAIDSTWHWQLEGQAETHRRFWRQLTLWLAQKDDTSGQRVWVQLDSRRFQQANRVEFRVGANNESGEPLPSAAFDVHVELPDGTVEAVRTVQRGNEQVGSFAETTLPGDYRIVVAARDGGETLESTSARFTVSDEDVELDQPAAELTLLANLAALTADAGGAGRAPEELRNVLEELQERTKEFEERITETKTLWDTWPMLLGFVSLMGTEWYLRKRWGLV
ncbi:hypothetical protein OAS39_11110 [Pirellulales bacterium]|nr:hypothetical protein [Pirellulales bacterium]